MTRLLILAAGCAAAITSFSFAQPTTPPASAPAKPAAAQQPKAPVNLDKPTLYVVGYAHLDTQWRWCYPQVIREFIPATLHNNFALFDKYPSYVFNFSGSRRYQMMKEYYPADYERLKKEIAAGRWFTCGSSVDENDANVPSAESLIRQVLYGNKYFKAEFNTFSDEFMLPDCFGFPAALPSVLAHCGVKGFSTQKLTWNAVVPIPFKIGVWNGPDGRGVIAALDPGAYVHDVIEDLSASSGWLTRINANGEKSGSFVDYHYYGVGDRGGAPIPKSVGMVQQSVDGKGPINVISTRADAIFNAFSPERRAKLPAYAGELELTEHSAGSLTSAAYMKRWNRKNELLADAAERASVMAWWMGGRDYPGQRLEDAWYLVLGSQMHDILPGTSHPRAYDFSWNDEIIAGNMFSSVATDAVGVIAGQMNTKGDGTSLIVFNPLSVEREDMVTATIPTAKPGDAVVTGPDGNTVAAQVLSTKDGSTTISFLAKVPSVGFATYNAQIAAPGSARSILKVSASELENTRYTVKINQTGDVSSIFDKDAKRELLSAPLTLNQCYEKPGQWPAWNQDWADRIKPVKEVVGGPAEIKIVENGPARVALEVTRHVGGSTFRQVISLTHGGDRVDFDTTIDWAARERSLRAAFPLAVTNKTATWDCQTGVVERPNSHKQQFEYAGQQWMDLTDAKGDYGVTIINDSKYGSDKPDDNTLRLTLLHTPGVRNEYQDQATQDLGRHHVKYSIVGHKGDWREAHTYQHADRVNQPLQAFIVPSHDGPLGKSFSLAKVSSPSVAITALKKSESGNEIIVRLRELDGKPAKGVRLSFAKPILSASEVDGQEREITKATVTKGEIIADIGGFELRAFSIKLDASTTKATAATSAPVTLTYNTDAISTNTSRADGQMGDSGLAFPAEQFPSKPFTIEDATFTFGSTADAQMNAVACKGQEVTLPAGDFQKLYILAATDAGDITDNITIGGKDTAIHFQDWSGFIGQWDHREWGGTVEETSFNWKNPLVGLTPGYTKPAPVAWFASHRHKKDGDTFYDYCYLFKHSIDMPQGAKSIRLPNNPKIKVFAITAVKTPNTATPASPLFDTLDDRQQDPPHITVNGQPIGTAPLTDAATVTIQPRVYFAEGSLRYTTDGSAPTNASPVFTAPILVTKPTTFKAAVFTKDGHAGPVETAMVNVTDTTPPTVTAVESSYQSAAIRVRFSEPVAPTGIVATLSPTIKLQDNPQLSDDGRSLIFSLDSGLAPGTPYKVNISGARDIASNAMKPVTLDITVPVTVYTLNEVSAEQMGKQIKDVKGLPTRGSSPWTLNMFVRTDKQPEPRTIIAGFGACEQTTAGMGRYIARFQGGCHLWSHNSDVASTTPLDIGKWQMLTATYDGKTLRLFKNAAKIGERDVQLSDDQPTISIAPIDPWDHKRSFKGDIRAMTIWNGALSEDSLKPIMDASLPK